MICPSRGRPAAAAELATLWPLVTDSAALRIVADADDPLAGDYGNIPGVTFLPPLEKPGLGPVLNAVAAEEAQRCDAIGFLGDDHRPRTPGWDTALIAALTAPNAGAAGVAYGNDLHQGARLPTAVVMSAAIVRCLGYMAPPGMTHLFLDDFWRRLGTDLGSLAYCPDVIIEHVHPDAGKAPRDTLYSERNSPQMWAADSAAYQQFLASQWPRDLARLRDALAAE